MTKTTQPPPIERGLDDILGMKGLSRKTLEQPVKALEDKYELLPAFLRVRGLVRQHIDSFNYFINHEMRKIIRAKGNERVTCDTDANFYLKQVVQPLYIFQCCSHCRHGVFCTCAFLHCCSKGGSILDLALTYYLLS